MAYVKWRLNEILWGPKGNRVACYRIKNGHGNIDIFFSTENREMSCRMKQQHFHENKQLFNIKTAVDIIQGVAMFMMFKDTPFNHRSLKSIRLEANWKTRICHYLEAYNKVYSYNKAGAIRQDWCTDVLGLWNLQTRKIISPVLWHCSPLSKDKPIASSLSKFSTEGDLVLPLSISSIPSFP